MRCFTGLDSPITKYFHCHEATEMPHKDRMEADMTHTFTDPWECMEKGRESDTGLE